MIFKFAMQQLGGMRRMNSTYQWRALTSEPSHAIGMPKPGHEIGYFISNQ